MIESAATSQPSRPLDASAAMVGKFVHRPGQHEFPQWRAVSGSTRNVDQNRGWEHWKHIATRTGTKIPTFVSSRSRMQCEAGCVPAIASKVGKFVRASPGLLAAAGPYKHCDRAFFSGPRTKIPTNRSWQCTTCGLAFKQAEDFVSRCMDWCCSHQVADSWKKLGANKQAFKGKQAIPLPFFSIKSTAYEEQSEVFWAEGGDSCAQGVVFCDGTVGIFVREGGVSCDAT